MNPPLIIRSASAYSKSILCVTVMDRKTWRSSPFEPENDVVYYNRDQPNPWGEATRIETNIISMTRYRYPDRDRQIQVALAAEGHVGFFGREEGFYEKIPGAGLWADDAEGRGYMSAIRQIGARLYACGGGRQLYRREGSEHWERFDLGMPGGQPNADDIIFADVNGPHEESIYVVGQNGTAYWKGPEGFLDLALPTSLWLQQIHVENEKTIWICGRAGLLLRGNHIDGFRQVAAGDSREAFLSMAKYEGRLYLAAETGLHMLEGDRIVRARTTLTPDLRDAHWIDVTDGVLWSIGYEDIARFDGEQWERLDLPGNPPIR
ncbi:hypothetical protein [Terrarubrum flagellatum]|uniref:hypothetical protein n=1 Tax=Terrirubrum flagellatum TaxID=2895980 RepID=UPI003144F95A